MAGTETISSSASLWRIELFGGLRAVSPERTLTRFSAGKARALLARLACFLDREHPREELIELLWPEVEPAAGRLRLRVAVNSLRKQLEPPELPAGSVLIAEGDSLRLNPASVSSDTREWDLALRLARYAPDDLARRGHLTRAMQLYRGELLPGFYDDWVTFERDRLGEAYLAALDRLIAIEAGAGDLGDALAHARQAVAAAPDSEERHQTLIRLLALSGRKPEAQMQLRKLSRLLREQFGTAPLPETRRLVDLAPLSRARETASASGCTGATVAVMQPAPELHAPAGRQQAAHVHLPLILTGFVGREAELDDLAELLHPAPDGARGRREAERLVVLTGPGGTGKTRLSVEVARRAAPAFRGGVYFVPLADIDRPERIPGAILAALAVPLRSGPSPMDQAVTALNGASADGERLLLVLDNMEQLLADSGCRVSQGPEADPQSAQDTVGELLTRAGHVSILATTRQCLGIYGEREYSLPPLAAPSGPAAPETLLEFPSVRLFRDRAQAARSDFQLTPRNADAVAALCERLEGVPLAIELAAGWARLLSPAQILERLRSRLDILVSKQKGGPSRHKSLEAAIAWSYNLLAPGQQSLFAQLSIFRSGWTMEAAAQVCQVPDSSGAAASVDGLMMDLAERSLIAPEESASGGRLRMLETVREFAWECLDADERERLARRHASWCLRLAERPDEPQEWLGRMDAERENMESALLWYAGASEASAPAADAERIESGLRLACLLHRLWSTRGYLADGRRLFGELLAGRERLQPSQTLARSMVLWAGLAHAQGDFSDALALNAEGLARYEIMGDQGGRAFALNGEGRIRWSMGEPAAARRACLEALSIERELGNQEGVIANLILLGALAHEEGSFDKALEFYNEALPLLTGPWQSVSRATVLGNMANIRTDTGDLAGAERLLLASLDIYREAGYGEGEARTLSNLGNIRQERGDPAEAVNLYRRALALARQMGNRDQECSSSSNLAWALHDMGELQQALEAIHETLRLARAIGYRRAEATALNKLGCMLLKRGDLPGALEAHQSALRIRVAASNRIGMVYSLWDLADLAQCAADSERAARLAAAAEGLRSQMSMALPAAEAAHYEGQRRAILEALGETRFDELWKEGQALSLEKALILALSSSADSQDNGVS